MTPMVMEKSIEGTDMAEEVKKPVKKGYMVKYGFNNDFVDLLNNLKEKYGE